MRGVLGFGFHFSAMLFGCTLNSNMIKHPKLTMLINRIGTIIYITWYLSKLINNG
tara:strand:+ start:354 stop:518 length:165 start_codon:yes stop_codon:yes gene_type:complete